MAEMQFSNGNTPPPQNCPQVKLRLKFIDQNIQQVDVAANFIEKLKYYRRARPGISTHHARLKATEDSGNIKIEVNSGSGCS